MKNRKNKTQRLEVRRILAAVRQELKDYRLEYEDMSDNRPVMHLNEIMTRAHKAAHAQLRGSDRDAGEL